MEWFTMYADYIIFGTSFVLLILAIVLLLNQVSFGKQLSGRKFLIRSSYVVNPDTKVKEVHLQFYNNNINDTRITGFGFIYLSQNIDYYRNYIDLHQLPTTSRVTISNHEALEYVIEPESLKTIIFDLNRQTYHMKKLSAFVTDSQGFTTVRKASIVRSHINKILSIEWQQEKSRLADIRKQQRIEHQTIRLAKHKESMKLWNEKWQMVLKSLKIKK